MLFIPPSLQKIDKNSCKNNDFMTSEPSKNIKTYFFHFSLAIGDITCYNNQCCEFVLHKYANSIPSQGGAIMAKCAICEKGAHFGQNVSHSHRRSNRMWSSNVKSVKVKVNGVPQKMYVCTSCLRSGKVERA